MPPLIIEVVGDTSNLDRTFRETARKAKRFEVSMSGAGRPAARLGAAAGAGFYGAQGLIRGLETSVEAASNLNEQMSKTELVFGRSAAGVKDWSRSSAQAMGLARDEALQTVSTFGALLRPLGVVGDEAASQSERLTQLGADLASFYNTSVADALAAIQSGLVGEAEPLRRYGVLLNEARVKAEAMRETGKKNADQLTETDKVLARIQLTFKDTAQAQGNFAQTSKEGANQLRTLEANARNAAATIGGPLLTGLTAVAGVINQSLAHSNLNVNQLLKLKQLADAGTFSLGRRYDAVEAGRAGLPSTTPGRGLVGGSTAGRRLSAASIRAANRQTMQRNQWFDLTIGRLLGRAEDPRSITAQIGRLQVIGALIQKRIAATRDVSRRLALEDQLADVNMRVRDKQDQIAAKLAADRQAKADERRRLAEKLTADREARLETTLGWLEFGAERAEATKTIRDDVKAQRAIERYWKNRIRHEGRKLEFVQELWRTRKRIRDLNKQNADIDPLAGLRQVSSRQLAGILAAGTGLGAGGLGRLRQNIAGAELQPMYVSVQIDGREVGRAVTTQQARTAHRTSRQTSGFRG